MQEADASCKRNAFIMLFNCAQEKAVEFLGTVLDQVSNFGDVLQFIVVELIRKVCRTNPNERVCFSFLSCSCSFSCTLFVYFTLFYFIFCLLYLSIFIYDYSCSLFILSFPFFPFFYSLTPPAVQIHEVHLHSPSVFLLGRAVRECRHSSLSLFCPHCRPCLCLHLHPTSLQ